MAAACILINRPDYYVIFDAVNGLYKLDKYITSARPIFLFIYHFHLDHTSGLHCLGKFNFKQGINIYVGKGRKKDFETLVNPPFTIGYKNSPKNITNLLTKIELNELTKKNSLPFFAEAVKQHHAYDDHGFRIKLENKIIAYTGDCGITSAALKLAKNADLLISECTYESGKANKKWGHLDPQKAATLARRTCAKQLILTHFDASAYTSLEKRKIAEQEARKIFPKTLAATDDFEFTL